ncbi:nitroreductase family protein [Williamsia sp. 1135]|uniref:nitroreductase family protein n=1 Tax=Williamsia sp. 1135 TaxID=1889262 RepID=UPI000A0F87DC|nr:nitroreductase family protein [Williamsia sp. 1135]ORM32605.1 nitroreductase [Williamsia sp. 1135]
MTDLLPLNPDELLTTTRTVRKRLDLERPVPVEVVREALEVALQAPSGSNKQKWHWLIVTDPELKKKVAEYYAASHAAYTGAVDPAEDPSRARIVSSSKHLAQVMGDVPVLVIGAIEIDEDDLPAGNQAGLWGSLLPVAYTKGTDFKPAPRKDLDSVIHLNGW